MISPVHARIVELYGQHILRKSALSIRGGAGVLERFLSGGDYRTALEIGTYRGVSAAEISQYVDRVITIDLKHGKLEHNGETHDRHAFWASLGVDNVTLIQVADDEEKRRVIDGLSFDIAFLDGAHDAAGVRGDFALTKRCGRVLFHDADDNRLRAIKPDASNHVFEFLATLPQEQLTFDDIFCFWQAPQ